MTDLTEQWKKGELPEGVYYCDTGNTVETLFTWGKNYHQLTNNKDEVYIPEMDDCEVLSAVPSYDELQLMNEAVNQAMVANIKLVEKLKIAVDTLSEIAELECSGSYMAYATIEKIKELDND